MICVVKPVEEKDVSVFSDLVAGALETDFPYKKETIAKYKKTYGKEYFLKVFENKKNVILGAYENEKLIGGAAVKPEEGGVVYIDWLIVDPKYRGAGVGSALLTEVDSWVLTNKHHYIYLYTETDKNIKFYEKRGFTYMGKFEGAWYGETEHVLSKKLKDTPFPEAFEK